MGAFAGVEFVCYDSIVKPRLVFFVAAFVAAAAVVLFQAAAVRPVHAAINEQGDCIPLVWKEKSAGSFVVLYTSSHVSLAEQIELNYAPALSAELENYEQAFGETLLTPITIRLYPSEFEYYCLNALAPLIGPEDLHSHIGTREIALIANVIQRRPSMWETRASNALRHELGVLFGEQLSDGEAPPGLLQGLGGYMQDPVETFPLMYEQAGSPTSPDRGWQRLWEEDIPVSDSLVLLQQTSIVAYLVDIYGWDAFVDFLTRIPEVQGYRQASQDVYQVSLQDLHRHWQRYFLVYVESRWQANVFHNYDLSQFEQLIAAGAYADAQSQLEAGMPMIVLFGDTAKGQLANDLLNRATIGVDAGNLALESRQAILNGDYYDGWTKAEQALALYGQLGDTRRVTELEAYRNISEEVLSLRDEMEKLSGGVAPLDPLKTERLVEIGRRLSELGDEQGTGEVQVALLLLGVGQQAMIKWVTIIGLVICVFIIWRRFRLVQRGRSDWGELL